MMKALFLKILNVAGHTFHSLDLSLLGVPYVKLCRAREMRSSAFDAVEFDMLAVLYVGMFGTSLCSLQNGKRRPYATAWSS